MRALLLTLLLCCFAATAVNAAERVPVRGGLHADYGRIVFDWPRDVGYEARLAEGDLIVTFAEAGQFDGPLMGAGLRGYAEAPQVSTDGRSLTLPLSGAFSLKHFRIGSKVVLDLRSTPAAAAETAAEKTPEAALPKVRVRGGRHEAFSRLVFDWAEPVGNVLEEAPGRARIVFDRPADFDTSAVRPEQLPQIAGLDADRNGVTVELAEGSSLRVRRNGSKVVLDVLAAANPSQGSPAEPAPTKAAAEKPESVEAKPGKPEPAEVKSAKPVVEDHSPRAPAPVAEAAPAEAAEAEPSAPEAVDPAKAPTPLVPKAMGGSAAVDPVAEKGQVAQADAPPAKGKKAEASVVPAERKTQNYSSAPTKPAVAIPDSARGQMIVRTEPIPSFLGSRAQGPKADPVVPVIMTFAWQRPTAAAVFRRGENLWLAFDRPPPKDVVKRIAAAVPHLGEVRLLADAGATILVIGANPTVVPRLSREGSRWTVDLRPRSSLPERGLAAPVIEDEGGDRVRYPVVGAGRMLWVTDPDAGDRLVVVPTRGAGMGMALPYSFPQFRSLQSPQGIVIQPLTSGIEVATIRSGVLVRDRDGLLVSDSAERRSGRRAEDPFADRPGLLELRDWRRGGLETYQDNRQALQRALSGLQGERRGVARLDLARFYFGHGLDSETLGSIQVIEDQNPRLAQDPEVRLMKGAAQLMMEDYRGAAVSLAHPALSGEREALLWQAALAALAEDWQAAATGFAVTLDLIDAYPRNVQLPLNLAAAESFLRAGDLEATVIQIGALLRDRLDDRELAQVKVIQGALELAKGDPERARELWSEARDSTHRPSQARARLALIDLGMEEGSLSPSASIAELERLRFAWRGDLFELTLLRKLAALYVEENRHRDALYALREAVTNFPDGPAARNSAQRMREIFAEIYHGPGDPDVPPLRALALYQEFMELTPVGPEGDRMITSLADRLVEVDLLDRAAELLEGQVRYRLEGSEKARVGTRLALVQLLGRNPEASLEALDASEVNGMNGELVLQRRQLRARALSALDRTDEALKLLENDNSLGAENLRADVHWRQRQWPEAVTSLSNLIPLLPPRRSMEEEESQLVVNLAVALMLSDQAVELEDLDRRYGAAMAKGPHAETFKLLVGDGEKHTIGSIADELAKVGEAKDFLANYRAQLSGSNLSEIN